MSEEIALTVKEIIQRTYNVKSIRLDTGPHPAFKAGQFMCVTIPSEKGCKRYLSISSSPTEAGYVEFTKKLTDSVFSRALNNLKPGDVLNVQLPMGKFTLEDNLKDMRSRIAFLSGGIGITPIRSICKYVVDKNLGTDIVLIYANRAVKDIAFKDDLELMQKKYPKIKVRHVLCESAPGFECLIGYINGAVVTSEIPDYRERKFFLCGPPQMVEAMKKMLKDELGLPQENIVNENFVGY